MPVKNANYIERKYQYNFTHLEKPILNDSKDTIGKVIIKRFGKDNQKLILFGPIVPFMPEFMSGKPEIVYNDLLEIGLNFYDSTEYYKGLNSNSFCLLINSKDSIFTNKSSYRKGIGDCGLEKNNIENKLVKFHLFYAFQKKRARQKIKTLEILPLTKEARTILERITFLEKNKLSLQFTIID